MSKNSLAISVLFLDISNPYPPCHCVYVQTPCMRYMESAQSCVYVYDYYLQLCCIKGLQLLYTCGFSLLLTMKHRSVKFLGQFLLT